MRRSSARLWSDLRKEASRWSSLAWLTALLFWLALSSSRFSHWHSLSHHLLRTKWLSAVRMDHQPPNPHSQHLPSRSSGSSVNLHQLIDTHTGMDSTKKPTFVSDQPNGFNVSVEAGDDNDEEDGFGQKIMLNDSAHHLQNSELHENAQNNQDRDASRQSEILDDRPSPASMSYRTPDAVQRDKAAIEHPKTCASVEEMGFVAASTVIDPSLRVRNMINDFFSKHGASHVRDLPGEEFCRRGFVFGRAAEDGLGNDIYKILTAAGLSIMLNRSLIIAEHGYTSG